MGPVNIIFHEWKALISDVKHAPGFRNKVGYLLNPPGWSHDGSTQTARVLQREYEIQQLAPPQVQKHSA